jgi:hypothetical protein
VTPGIACSTVAIATWLGLLDQVSPLPVTRVDHAIREEGERLRKAFPTIDFDHTGARNSPPDSFSR